MQTPTTYRVGSPIHATTEKGGDRAYKGALGRTGDRAIAVILLQAGNRLHRAFERRSDSKFRRALDPSAGRCRKLIERFARAVGGDAAEAAPPGPFFIDDRGWRQKENATPFGAPVRAADLGRRLAYGLCSDYLAQMTCSAEEFAIPSRT